MQLVMKFFVFSLSNPLFFQLLEALGKLSLFLGSKHTFCHWEKRVFLFLDMLAEQGDVIASSLF